jgi:hypothetical protein
MADAKMGRRGGLPISRAEPEVTSLMSIGDFTVGQPVRVSGIHKMHWEWPRFEVKVRRRWLWSQGVLCQLVAAEGLPPSPLDAIGGELPGDWRHHPPLVFHVVADVTPLAQGSFGHRGTLKWQLRVDHWVEVIQLGKGS